MEAVANHPHEYYPWILKQFAPFWQRIQREVNSENRPTHEVMRLHRTLADDIAKLAIQQDYTEGFDAVAEGHIDELLRTCYERMVVPHDIQYNTTVWQHGLPFTFQAIHYMPRTVFDQIVAKHAGSSFAEYLQKEYERTHQNE